MLARRLEGIEPGKARLVRQIFKSGDEKLLRRRI